MAVYVDNAFKLYTHPVTGKRMRMSHLFADTREELDAMADKIGVARKHRDGDHFDICKAKRDMAIRMGALPVHQKIASTMLVLGWRRKRRLLTVEEAEDALGWSRGSGLLPVETTNTDQPTLFGAPF